MKNITIAKEFENPDYYLLAYLPVISGKKILLVPLSSIIYIEANGSYSKIFTTQNQPPYQTCKNIGFYEGALPKHSFFRVHSKFIINLNKIVCIQREHHWSLEMSNQSLIKVSDQKKYELLKSIGLKYDL